MHDLQYSTTSAMARAEMLKPLVQLAIVLFCLSTFIWFRYECMSNEHNSVVASYCMDDNKVRAVVSAIFTVVVYFIGVSLLDAVNAFRMYMLVHGINEGVFTALGSDKGYRTKSIRSKWAIVFIVIMLLKYSPGSVQFLSNLATQSVALFVENESTVFVAKSRNYTTDSTIIDRDVYIANLLVPLLRNYASSARSKVVPRVLLYGTSGLDVDLKGLSRTVETNVSRNNIYSGANITKGDENSNNYILTNDIYATIATQCASYSSNETVLPKNASYSVTIDGSSVRNGYTSRRYNVEGALYLVSLSELHAINKNGTTVGLTSVCNSTIDFLVGDIVYNIDTQAIEHVVSSSNETTLNRLTMGRYIRNITTSPEYAIFSEPNVTNAFKYSIGITTGTQGNGLFDLPYQNAVHARVCASLELSLSALWSSTLNTRGDIIQAGIENVQVVPAHSLTIQAYMHEWVAWIFASILAFIMLLISITSVILFAKSPIKRTNEHIFADRLSDDAIVERRADKMHSDDRTLRVRAGQNMSGDIDYFIYHS